MTGLGEFLQPYQHLWSGHSKFTDAAALPETQSSWKQCIYVRQFLKYIKHVFHHKPKFSQMQCLCIWAVMYHYHISVGQADIHHVCWSTWLTRHRSIVLFHKPAATPERLASLAAHTAHAVLAGKISPRLSATSLHARTEAQIPTLKDMDRHAVRLWLSPCHSFFLFHLDK